MEYKQPKPLELREKSFQEEGKIMAEIVQKTCQPNLIGFGNLSGVKSSESI